MKMPFYKKPPMRLEIDGELKNRMDGKTNG